MNRLLCFTLLFLTLAATAETPDAQSILRRAQQAAERTAERETERAAERAAQRIIAQFADWAEGAVVCALGDEACAQGAESEGRPVVFTDGDGEPLPEREQPYAPDASGLPAGFDLDGTAWVRAESSYNPNDGMRIRVEETRALLTEVPRTASSAVWQDGVAIWRDLTPAGDLRVLGSDGSYYAARLTAPTEERLVLDIFHNGAGSDQTWQRVSTVAPPGTPWATPAPTETSPPPARETREAVLRFETVQFGSVDELGGDEYVYQVVPLRGVIGEGDLRQPRPLPITRLAAGSNYVEDEDTLTLLPSASIARYDDLQPFEVFGAVVLLVEVDNTPESLRERGLDAAARRIGMSFREALSPVAFEYDLSDHSEANVRRVRDAIVERLRAFMGMERSTGYTDAVHRSWENGIRAAALRDDDDLVVTSLQFGIRLPGRDTVTDPAIPMNESQQSSIEWLEREYGQRLSRSDDTVLIPTASLYDAGGFLSISMGNLGVFMTEGYGRREGIGDAGVYLIGSVALR
ncbi:MAG: hypothetical protein AAGI52_08680 [Bacteroidota bacterium]